MEIWDSGKGRCKLCSMGKTKVNITDCLPCDEESDAFFFLGFCFCPFHKVSISRTTCGRASIFAEPCPVDDEDIPDYCYFPLNRFLPECAVYYPIFTPPPVIIPSAGNWGYLFNVWLMVVLWIVGMFYN
jgi:hypothetical protein